MVDAALHDEDPICSAQLARSCVHRVEDNALRGAGDVVEPQEHHRLALLRRQRLDRGHDPPDRNDLAVAAALELREPAVRLQPQLVAHRVQGMLRDVAVHGQEPVARQGHVAAHVALGQQAQRGLVLHRAHAVLDAARLQLQHRLPHVVRPARLSGVGHYGIARAARALEIGRDEPAGKAFLGAAETDGDDHRVRDLLEQRRGVGPALQHRLAGDVGDEPRDGPAARLGRLQPPAHDLQGPPPPEAEALVVVRREVGLDVTDVLRVAPFEERIRHLLVGVIFEIDRRPAAAVVAHNTVEYDNCAILRLLQRWNDVVRHDAEALRRNLIRRPHPGARELGRWIRRI